MNMTSPEQESSIFPQASVQHLNLEAFENLPRGSVKPLEAVLMILPFLPLLALMWYIESHPWLGWVVGFTFAGLTVAAWKIGSAAEMRHARRIEEAHLAFAQANGFAYAKELTSPSNLPGLLFDEGYHKTGQHVVSGVLEALPFRFFRYSFLRRSDRTRKIFVEMSVWEFGLPAQQPHILIDSFLDRGHLHEETLPPTPPGFIRLSTTYAFDRYFRISTLPGQEVETLALLTPDVLETLLRSASSCDIEIVGNRLYFYWPGRGYRHEEMAQMKTVLVQFFRELGPKLRRLPAPDQEPTNFVGNPYAAAGRRADGPLQRPLIRTTPALLLAGMVTSFILTIMIGESDAPLWLIYVPWIGILLAIFLLQMSRRWAAARYRREYIERYASKK